MFCESLRCEKKLTYHEKGNSFEDEIWAGEFSLVNTLFEQARFGMNHLQVFLFNFKNKADKFKNKKEPENKINLIATRRRCGRSAIFWADFIFYAHDA